MQRGLCIPNTNSDETLLDVQRPVILGSRTNVITECDLISRAVMIETPPIAKVKSEKELEPAWNEANGCIYGGLLGLVSKAIHELPSVSIENLPRMADFAKIGYAIGGQEFLDQYSTNNDDLLAPTLADPVVESIISLMADRTQWEGTHSQLAEIVKRNDLSREELTKYAASLSRNELNRYSSVLRQQGISFERHCPSRPTGTP